MIENEKLNNELKFQQQQTQSLMEENDKLKEDNRNFKKKVELFQQLEAELSKKNAMAHHTIKTLTQKGIFSSSDLQI